MKTKKYLVIVLFLFLLLPLEASASEEIHLQVQGMTCDHCVQSISSTLLKTSGVSDVKVSLEQGIVHVTTAEQYKGSADDLAKQINNLGYQATVIENFNPSVSKTK